MKYDFFNYNYRSAWIRALIRVNGLPLHINNDIIFFRPLRGSLEESMKELEIFTSVDEMFDYIAKRSLGRFDASDLSVTRNLELAGDVRIGWSEIRYVCTKRYGDEVYDVPQCVGLCSFEKITKASTTKGK